MIDTALLQRAARLIDEADGLVIAAGAGMGVDSGLPDFRGTEGFWRAYPALRRSGIRFETIASPLAFEYRPRQAWGFYGHRLQLYRRTVPHAGFGILRRWAAGKPHGAFVFTSNVDGQFQKAGFAAARVCEVHGSIHDLQCLAACIDETWPAHGFEPEVDEEACELVNDFPRCPACGGIARPNVLMFGDPDWIGARADARHRALEAWAAAVGRPVVIELGAGTSIPSVRRYSERFGAHYLRINPREAQTPGTLGIGIDGGALAVLTALDERLR